jgi:1-acyl-sn-glycerol-3-phosphate acyltransferase
LAQIPKVLRFYDQTNYEDSKPGMANKPFSWLASHAQRPCIHAQEIGMTNAYSRQKMSHALAPTGLLGKAFYGFFYFLASVIMAMLFPVRVTGANCVPKSGGFLLVANHESFLDPPLLGLTCYRRQLHYVAMAALFKVRSFRWLIESLGAVKIEREGNATAGLRASLAVIRDDHGLVIFPEGSRSADGQLQPLKPGILLLVRRCNVPIVIAGIAGAFEAWPLFKRLPRPRPIWIHYLRWSWPENATDSEALADLETHLRSAVDYANRKWKNIGGREIYADKNHRKRINSS